MTTPNVTGPTTSPRTPVSATAALGSGTASPPSDGLIGLADGVWMARAPVGFLGLRLTSSMVVFRLAGGDLLVFSPVALTPERRAAVEAQGRVAHLYAPNLFHHLWIGDWATAFPGARLHAPAGLSRKHPGLRVDRLHGADAAPEPGFAGVIDELPIEGFRLRETALLHRPSGTLAVADLVCNVGRPTHGWTATYARAMGFYDRIALSRVIRWTGFDDKKAARRSLKGILDRPFDRVIVGHGEPVLAGGRDALAGAYGWLLGR